MEIFSLGCPPSTSLQNSPVNNLRWIWSYVHTKKWAFLAGFLLMMLETLSGLAGLGIQKWIIDDIFTAGRYELLPLYLSLFTLFTILAPVLFTLVAMVHHNIGYSMRVVLAKTMMRKLQTIPIPVLHKERTTRYTDYITTDVYQVGENVSYQIPKWTQQIVLALLLMGCIGYFSPLILVTVTVFSCSYIALGKYFADKFRATSRQVEDRRTELLIHIEEGVASTREVVAYHRMQWEMKIYDALFKRYYETVMTEGKLANRSMLLSDPLKWLSNLSVLFIGGYLVVQGKMSTGAYVVIYQYASQLVGSFQEVFNYYLRYNRTLAHIDRLRNVQEIESIAEGSRRLTEQVNSIVFDQVQFAYADQDQLILNRFDMTIPMGKKVALVGTSGGGKSTVAKLLVRHYEPTAGQIFVNGVPLETIARDDWRQKAAITFQEPYLFPDTVRNNIVFGRQGVSVQRLHDVCRYMKLDEVIAGLPDGYDTEIGERGVMLSGGQRQRLALARAVLCDPDVLILDEATSALDVETERQIQRNLDELRKGRTTILIAHRLSTVQNADIIFVIDQGQVVEQGTHEQLMQLGSVYSKLVLSLQEKEPGLGFVQEGSLCESSNRL